MSARWRSDPRTSRPPSAPRSSTSGRATASSTRSSARARGRRRWPWRWPPTTGIDGPRPPRRAQRRLPRPRAWPPRSGEAVVVLTTSGTAAVELHPAVVEADLAGVPLLVCTADRPPELHDVGAPQAIDQTHLFGRSARWFHAPGVADEAAADRWRALAARAHAEATGTHPGPVHLDLAFREPLVGTAGDAAAGPARPTARGCGGRPAAPPHDSVVDLAGDLAGHRGLIVAGRRLRAGATYVVQIADRARAGRCWRRPPAPVWGAPMTIPGVRRAAPHRARPRARADRAPRRPAGLAGRQRVARRAPGAVQIVAAGPRVGRPPRHRRRGAAVDRRGRRRAVGRRHRRRRAGRRRCVGGPVARAR